MKHRIYLKDMRQALTKSWGRFFSIFSLMALGSMALIGLKITAPNMQHSAQNFITEHHLQDLSVMSTMGLDDDDQKELSSIKNATVEFGYLTDVTKSKSDKAFRIFSKPKDLANYKVTSGKLPSKSTEIALNSKQKGEYKVGDTISFTQSDNFNLKTTTFTITGFVDSSEIWDKSNLGSSTAGTGNLEGYGVVTESAFESDVYMIARFRYNDLKNVQYYTANYSDKMSKHQNELEKIVSDNGDKRIASIKTEKQKEIDNSKKTLASKEGEIKQSEKKVSQQEARLIAAGLVSNSPQSKELSTAKAQIEVAKKEIVAKKTDLSKTQETVDRLSAPTYTVYNRTSIPGGEGYMAYDNSANSIAAVGNIFPVVLYIVAAMVTLTTMTRFVDEERTNTGLFKALGYTNRQIMTKFLLYGLVASLTGTIVGILFGNFVLSPRIAAITASDTVLGLPILYPHPFYFSLALILALLSAVLPTYLVASKELVEKPAQLLQAKPPVVGSRIILERITFIWKCLNFTYKVTARNIFRYKQRMLMTIFGVAGSVALLFAGLGIQSSISGVSDRQFKEVMTYDMILTRNTSASDGETDELNKLLKDPTIKSHEAVYMKNGNQTIPNRSQKETVTIISAEQSALKKYVQLQNRRNQKSYSLNDNGIYLTEKLAKLYDVKVGDSINLKLNNQTVSAKVAGITEMYTGHFIFISPTYYENLTGQTPEKNAEFIALKNSSISNVKNMSNNFLSLDAVSSISQNIEMAKLFDKTANSLSSVMLILIILSIVLAVVILYNLTNINIAERIRELSTIKVLGFHNKEVTMYIYRETIALSIVGIITGILGGYFLHQVILSMIGSSSIMFDPSVARYVYIVPIVTIIIILAVLGWIVNHHLRNVDMLEALKSVE